MNTGTTNQNQTTSENGKEFEIIHLEKTKKSCSLCEDFASAKAAKDELIAVMSCEGACLRGEVSRRVANNLCFDELPEKTARVCLGGAFTKNTGQRNMVRSATRVIALEGCVIECASRMMKGVIPDLETEVIIVDKYYNFNKNLFAINEVTEDELIKYSIEATDNIKTIIMS
ncbi:MAG: putative zinc-binding protein [Candidatus Latescibacterota bacterium]|jgi:uncharacterized metal-binding protein